MQKLFENWRRYLNEEKEESKENLDLEHVEAGEWSTEGLKNEYKEEIVSAHKDDIADQRWPEIKDFDNYPFLKEGAEEKFIKAVKEANAKELSLSEMKDIYNHAQVYDIIELYEKEKSSKDVRSDMEDFFGEKGGHTDNKEYKKVDSYLRWVDTFDCECSVKGTKWPPEPPIVVEQEDGSLAHVSGQTRQTGALTNKKILPYIILKPSKQ